MVADFAGSHQPVQPDYSHFLLQQYSAKPGGIRGDRREFPFAHADQNRASPFHAGAGDAGALLRRRPMERVPGFPDVYQ
ncbi:hypothetical protein D1872_295990 [compost metagenome]